VGEVEDEDESESPHEAINNQESFVESNYHPLRCSSVMNLFWGFSSTAFSFITLLALPRMRLRDPAMTPTNPNLPLSPLPTPSQSLDQVLIPSAFSAKVWPSQFLIQFAQLVCLFVCSISVSVFTSVQFVCYLVLCFL